MLHGLRTATLHVHDLTAARDWYARVLGHGPYFDQPFYVGFDVGGYELGLQPADDDGPVTPGAAGVYWGVTDVPAALSRLVELGAVRHREPQDVGGGIVVGAVLDPFGHELSVICNPHFAPPLTYAAPDDLSEHNVACEVVVATDPMTAWRLWSSSEGLAAWWIDRTRIELRPGGHFEIYFDAEAPAGQQGSEECRVLSHLPGRMLSFTWNAPPHLDRVRGRPTWVVVLFDAVAEGTRVQVTQLGWPQSEWADEPQWAENQAYFARAWSMVLGLFERHFAG